ncbi:hypothetical protein Pint_12052 [Pistacia integerrima]|uniref:Uncharacterized protein n=1 Tax=Pistacia integerrima TaxID=434235 RepID=A0ACC0XGJ9_9ROSI|nr:hypothetical protein Pint_12052 [Pistacia integerrima]
MFVCFFADDLTRYRPLHAAVLHGDLGWVRSICDSDQHAIEARITVNLDTALHAAVGTGMAIDIVKYLLNRMSPDQMVLKNSDGSTVLSIAAIAGNMEATKLLVKKDESLSGVKNNSGWIPLILAAQNKQEEMIDYLLQYSGNIFMPDGNFSTDTICVFFMNLVTGAEFYGELIMLQLLLSYKYKIIQYLYVIYKFLYFYLYLLLI